MKKVFTVLVLVILLSLLFTGYAHAGVWEKARGWLTGEVL